MIEFNSEIKKKELDFDINTGRQIFVEADSLKNERQTRPTRPGRYASRGQLW